MGHIPVLGQLARFMSMELNHINIIIRAYYLSTCRLNCRRQDGIHDISDLGRIMHEAIGMSRSHWASMSTVSLLDRDEFVESERIVSDYRCVSNH